MRLSIFLPTLLVVGLLTAGCGAARATAAPAAAPTSLPALLSPQSISSPPATVDQSTPKAIETPTAEPFVLDFTPLPTETALPTLELPTEAVRAPALQAWDGLPTYPSESKPDYYFRVSFDPGAWALTKDAYGSPALVHRAISNCVISPTAGRGLPPNAAVEHDMRKLGDIRYQISSTSVNGVKQFVTYTAGDGRIYTSFQVSLDERPDQCLLEAETLLSTLKSVPLSQATPIATP
jgi:hypothetical protein